MTQFRFSTDDESSFFSSRHSSLGVGWWEINKKKGEITMELMIERLNIENLEKEELTQVHKEQIDSIDEIINAMLNKGEKYGGCIELLNNELEHIQIDVFSDDYDGHVGLIKYKSNMQMFNTDYWIKSVLTHLISIYGFMIVNY